MKIIKCSLCKKSIVSLKDIHYTYKVDVFFSLKEGKNTGIIEFIRKKEPDILFYTGKFICSNCHNPLPFEKEEEVRKYIKSLKRK